MNTGLLNKKNARAGMTLMELLVALTIGMVVMAAVAVLTVFTVKSFVALGNYNDLDQASRNALDVMSRNIRQRTAVTAYTTNRLVFDAGALGYYWDPVRTTLYQTNGGQTRILLRQCDYLRFGTSQRNPSSNFNFASNSTPATVKLIDVSWRCSRRMFNQKVNTESVQTAKIVIRN